MSALQELERTLARAVDAGAAANPGRAAGRVPVDARPPHRGRRRRWPRGRGRLLVTILVAGGVTTGALAATGALRVTSEPSLAEQMPFAPDEGAGVPKGPVRLLPLRVKDPQGGPPWALRIFKTTRSAACAQAGQLYRGRFGLVEDDGTGRPLFRISQPMMGFTTSCTNPTVDGLPAFPGMRTERRIGGAQSSPNCGTRPGRRDPCPIQAVTVLRFGMLGPQAQSIRTTALKGGGPVSQEVRPGTGGAYLFVDAPDPAPWRQMERSMARAAQDVDRKFPRPDYGSLTRAERSVADRKWLERNRYVGVRNRQDRRVRQALGRRLARIEPAYATFSSGQELQVLGGDATAKRLPGVTYDEALAPKDARADLHVRYVAADRAVSVAFRAPVALDRMQRAFIVTIHGPRAPACVKRDLGYEYVGKQTAKGQLVRVRVKSPQNPQGRGPVGWCPGSKYVVRLRLRTLSAVRSQRTDQEVGRATFTAR